MDLSGGDLSAAILTPLTVESRAATASAGVVVTSMDSPRRETGIEILTFGQEPPPGSSFIIDCLIAQRSRL